MEHLLPILVVFVMFGVLGVLALGMISLARGGNPQRSNRLMQSRVILQAIALLLFAIFMMIYRR